mgnify:CR=1 FL=1
MHLVQDLSEGHYLVHHVGTEGIQIGDRLFSESLLLSPDRCVEGFPARDVAGFDETAIAHVLALEPALVLIGTGSRQHLAPPALMGAFLKRGIGVEAMDSHAAARTFNLLAGEGRRVVVAFLL